MKASRCIEPRIEDELLDSVRIGATSLGREQARHLEACASCQEGVGRTQRMLQVWETIEPHVSELAAARARFVAARSGQGRRARGTPGAIAVAVVLAAVIAGASVRMGGARLGAQSQLPARPELSQSPALHPSPRPARTVEIVPVVGLETLPAQAPPVDATQDRLPAEGERSKEAPDVQTTARARQAALAPPAAASVTAPVEASARGGWFAAASAMRAGDFRGAEAAFGELAGSSDPHTRDTARLARAQVWIAQGRREEARRDLADLARAGATAQLRRGASEALEGLRGNSSPNPASGTNRE